jgi:hypothetical protein
MNHWYVCFWHLPGLRLADTHVRLQAEKDRLQRVCNATSTTENLAVAAVSSELVSSFLFPCFAGKYREIRQRWVGGPTLS